LNILFLSELFYPHGGGAELATYLYARLLSEEGFHVVVLTNRFGEEPEISEERRLTVYRLPLFSGTESVKYSILSRIDVLLSGFMKKMMKWADVVYVPRFWFSAIPLAKAYRRPVITHFHDYIPICSLSNFYDVSKNVICSRKNGFCSINCVYAYEKAGRRGFGAVVSSVLLNSFFGPCFMRIVQLSDAAVCVSKAQRNLIVDNHAGWASKIHVIYNPLPNIPLVNVQADDFGYFGGSGYMKGFPVLYKAAAYINHIKHERLRIHATKFSGFDEKFRGMLRELGIFAYDKLSKEEYDDLRCRIRTVIVPSVWEEPLPYVVTEAMLGGKLLIASRIGGIPEQVAGCKGAFLFDAGDHERLIDRVLYVKNLDRETMNDLGLKNREQVMKQFSNEKILGNFIDLLTKVSSHESNNVNS
jgi:glycosyltransferase involved in cell wall biosynthesis